MVKSEVFSLCGGFAEEYSPGYYEDADLCARIWSLGMRVVYEPSAALTHYEYASFSSGRPPSISAAIIERHRDMFVRRNRTFLSKQSSRLAVGGQRLCDRGFNAPKHVFILDDLVPDPAFGSGFTRAFALVESFLALGWRVTVWARNERGTSFDETLRDMGVLVLSPIRSNATLQEYFARVSRDIDVFWCARTHNFHIAAALLRDVIHLSERPKFVADSEAISTLRELAYRDVLGVKSLQDVGKMVALELEGASEFDEIVAVNWLDQKWMEESLNREVSELGLQESSTSVGLPFTDRHGLLFCGAVHQTDSPNLDSLLWYIKEVHPIVLSRLPEAELKILGYWEPSLTLPKELTDSKGVQFVGAVSADRLMQELNNSRVFVAPTRFAGGVAQKIHSAMANGLPCVVSPLLKEQLHDDLGGDYVYPVLAPLNLDPSEFASCVVELYQNKESWQTHHQIGLDYMLDNCSSERFTQMVSDVIYRLGYA